MVAVSRRSQTQVPGPPIVAMVGGGQLARMTHQAAIPLGQSLRVLAQSPDDSAALADRLAPFVADTTALAFEAVAGGKRILLEGAQAAMLDLDAGADPYAAA